MLDMVLAVVVLIACFGAYAEIKSGHGDVVHDAITGALLSGGTAVAALLMGGIVYAVLGV